ncbi:MAG: glycosyltransferase family 1 protein [Sphingobacteriales bacterium]|nr:MAG: glycosyltransferase family 1 protein [Sphingobacteriales bacterium]
MKIAIEAQRLFRARKHGMDVVAYEFLRRLPAQNDSNQYHIIVKNDVDNCIKPSKNKFIHPLKAIFYPLWEQFLLPSFCKKININVLHCTANTAPVFYKKPLILTLHDIIFLQQNNFSNKGSWYQSLGNTYRSLVVPIVVKKAIRIITVSQYQKDIIVQKLNILPQKISVIHNGVDERFFSTHTALEIQNTLLKYDIKPGYIFFMANTEPRKNTVGVLQAFALLCTQTTQAPRLVIKGLNSTQLKSLLEIHQIDLIGYVDYNDLPLIYQGATILWFPSISEGFGLPIIEAMASGVPVITSNLSCMPEIAGDAAILIDPLNFKTIVEATLTLLNDSALYNQIVLKGKKRALDFTWDKAVKKLLLVYSEIEKQISL